MEVKELCVLIQEERRKETEAREKRVNYESLLFDQLPHKLEGTETTNLDNYKISITTKLTRKLDYDAYQGLALPANLSFVKTKPEIDLKRLRAIEMVDPGIIAKCVTSTPAKPSIKIEEVE